ncbi:hypothetical protein CXB51_000767 [Gossypium anomalum]|uniref:Protein kinase domain-containing protein n=1 Tax=Gossypium anomalum TaxID=47600 RepID=A0A8J5ZAP3_9ROSI|nr:hypothetical protein CXB51_000767 [Gossypium anomalum]
MGGSRSYSANPSDYKLLKEVAYGTSATVYRAIFLSTNDIVAVKCLDLDCCNSNLDDTHRKAQTMSLIDHSNIIRAYCSFVVDHNLWVGNILLDNNGTVKLADFGVSTCMFDAGDRQRSRNTFVGTACWMALEVLQPGSGNNSKSLVCQVSDPERNYHCFYMICVASSESGLRLNTTQSSQTSTASSAVKLKSPNRKCQTGGDPISTQESVAN